MSFSSFDTYIQLKIAIFLHLVLLDTCYYSPKTADAHIECCLWIITTHMVYYLQFPNFRLESSAKTIVCTAIHSDEHKNTQSPVSLVPCVRNHGEGSSLSKLGCRLTNSTLASFLHSRSMVFHFSILIR